MLCLCARLVVDNPGTADSPGVSSQGRRVLPGRAERVVVVGDPSAQNCQGPALQGALAARPLPQLGGEHGHIRSWGQPLLAGPGAVLRRRD